MSPTKSMAITLPDCIARFEQEQSPINAYTMLLVGRRHWRDGRLTMAGFNRIVSDIEKYLEHRAMLDYVDTDKKDRG